MRRDADGAELDAAAAAEDGVSSMRASWAIPTGAVAPLAPKDPRRAARAAPASARETEDWLACDADTGDDGRLPRLGQRWPRSASSRRLRRDPTLAAGSSKGWMTFAEWAMPNRRAAVAHRAEEGRAPRTNLRKQHSRGAAEEWPGRLP